MASLLDVVRHLNKEDIVFNRIPLFIIKYNFDYFLIQMILFLDEDFDLYFIPFNILPMSLEIVYLTYIKLIIYLSGQKLLVRF